jgi:hypothetical protein
VFISHYEYRPDGYNPIRLDLEDVVHLRLGLDPRNPRLGISPLHSVLREVFTDDEAANYTASLLRNAGVPGVVLSPDGDYAVPEGAEEATKERFREKTTGDRRGEPLVFNVPTKMERLSFSPTEMNLRDLRHIPEERVCAVLGFPPGVVGLGAGLDRNTFSNYTEARKAAYQVMVSLWGLVANGIHSQLLPHFERDPRAFAVEYDVSGVEALREDENARTDRLRRDFTAGLITRAAYLRSTGREAEPADDIYLLPFNVIEVPKGGSPLGSDAPPPKRASLKSVAGGEGASSMQRDLIARFNRERDSAADEMTTDLEASFLTLGRDCARAYQDQVKGIGRSNGSYKQDEEDVDELITRIFAAAGVPEFAARKLRPTFEDYYEEVLLRTARTIAVTAGVETDLPDEAMRAVIAEGGTRAGLVDVMPDTRSAIFRSITEGRANGEGVRDVARRIRDDVPAGRFRNAGPRYRAQLIARTETKYAQNISSLTVYEASPNVSRLLAFDAQGVGESDADCEARNGRMFTVSEARYELSLEHPNGTLSFAPVVDPAAVPEGVTNR